MSISTPSNGTSRGRHPVNVTHLVMGLVFLGVAGAWGLRQLDVIDAGAGRWVLPVILVLAGAAGLVAAIAKGVARDRSEPLDDPDDDLDHDPGTGG